MTDPTFHEGERAVQARVGVAERMALMGPRVIRDFMPDQHRAFFAQLPFVMVGLVDEDGQPWASVLAAPPGFVQSADPVSLTVNALPVAGDPVQAAFKDGAAIGLLGIEPHTRRRNRMNGTVQQVTATGFGVQVGQSFGNCPKYIQAREPVFLPPSGQPPARHSASQLDDAARQLIANADTVYIATSHPATSAPAAGAPLQASYGVDVSHRGGKPGFIRADAEGTLTMPDFTGNFFFNTLGNIAVHPQAGLLFMDFESGDLLYLATQAEIVWDVDGADAFDAAQRLLRFKVSRMVRLSRALPLRWGAAELSPFLAATGAWA